MIVSHFFSQVLAIYLYGGNISVELTSSDNIANNFAEEWRFFINNYWSAVSQVKQKWINLLGKTSEGPDLQSQSMHSLTPKRRSLTCR